MPVVAVSLAVGVEGVTIFDAQVGKSGLSLVAAGAGRELGVVEGDAVFGYPGDRNDLKW